jgi:hypothetical protein
MCFYSRNHSKIRSKKVTNSERSNPRFLRLAESKDPYGFL